MSAAGELRLRGMFGTGFVTFHWQVCDCVDLFDQIQTLFTFFEVRGRTLVDVEHN